MSEMFVVAVVATDDDGEPEGFFLLTVEQGIMAFEDEAVARQYADQADDVPKGYVLLPYQADMGPCVVIV